LNQKRQAPLHRSEEEPHLSKKSTRHSLIEPHVLQYGDRESRAYLSLRFCPSYVAVSSVMHQLSKRVPNFAPKSMLDYGTGPGTAIWCVHSESRAKLQGDK
jgi:ribosomal protein RSM22 (predicted rRNA methylase)